MKKGSYWFSLLTEKQQSEFRANANEIFYRIMDTNYKDFHSFLSGSFTWSESPEGGNYWVKIYEEIDTELKSNSPIVHTHFHIVYLTGENKCTGVNIEAVDMIDALEQFKTKNNGVKPIYCYAK
jgi:hypothetical protein